jgi:hypothetical protein
MTAMVNTNPSNSRLRLVHSVEFLPPYIENSVDWRRVHTNNDIEPDDLADIERQLGQSLKGVDFIVGPTALGTYGTNTIMAVSGAGQNLILELIENKDRNVSPNLDRINSDWVSTLWLSEVDVALFMNTVRKNGYAVVLSEKDIDY